MAETQVERPRVRVRALARQLTRRDPPPSRALSSSPGATSATGSRSGCQRLCITASSATRAAAARHVGDLLAPSSARGEPSWCSETIPRRRLRASTGVTICAASPPYASRMRWNAGSSYAVAQSACTTCRPARDLERDGLVAQVDRPLLAQRADAGRERLVRDGERVVAGQVLAQRHAARAGLLEQPAQDVVDLGHRRRLSLADARRAKGRHRRRGRARGGRPRGRSAGADGRSGAVIANPFAGRYVDDLEPLIDQYCEPLGRC